MTLPDQLLSQGTGVRTRVMPQELDDPRQVPVHGSPALFPVDDGVFIHVEPGGQVDLSQAQFEAPPLEVLPDSSGSGRFEAAFT